MSHSKRILEQQLAEVAAGTRNAVDPYWQQLVAHEESRAVEADTQHQKKSLELAASAEQHTRDLARAAAGAERDRQAILRAAEAQLQQDQAHQARVEALEESRLEEARRFQAEMRDHTAKQLTLQQAALKIQQREAQNRQESLEEQTRLLEQQAHEARLQSSPSYAAALSLRALKRLEDLQRDRREADQILAGVPALQERLQAQLAVERARDAQRVADAAAESSREHAAAAAAHAKEMAAHEVALQAYAQTEDQLRRALQDIDEALVQGRLTVNPGTWLGEAARARQRLRDQRGDLLTSLENNRQKAKIRALSRPAPPAPDQSTLKASTKQALTRAAALNSGVQADFARLQQQVVDWLMSEPRDEATHAWFGRHCVDSPPRAVVEFEHCVALDHQRRDGLMTVQYPGLGDLPFGPAQAEMMARLEAARRDVASFRASGPAGLRPYQALAVLLNAQLLPDGCGQFLTDDETTPKNFEERDALYDEAVDVVLAHRSASVSLIQRQLKIDQRRATRLMKEVMAAGVVTADPATGRHEVCRDLPQARAAS